jgi:hypothetical protein
MFDFTSRYYAIETTTLADANGRVIAYKRRRFLPPAERLQIFAEVTLLQGDRLDVVTARTLGASEQFWQVCDANSAMNPFDINAENLSSVRIPMPQTPR